MRLLSLLLFAVAAFAQVAIIPQPVGGVLTEESLRMINSNFNYLATHSSGGAWGSITGTLSTQTDLQNALNAKAALSSGNTLTGYNDISGGRLRLPEATFASAPTSPVNGQEFLFTDASSTGTCTGGGSAFALCRWSGAAWQAIGGGAATGGETCSTGSIAAASLTAAATTQEFTIMSNVSQKVRFRHVMIAESSTQFSGTPTLTASMGVAGGSDQELLLPLTLKVAGGQNFRYDVSRPPQIGSSTYNVAILFTGGANLNGAFSQGSINWEACYVTMP